MRHHSPSPVPKSEGPFDYAQGGHRQLRSDYETGSTGLTGAVAATSDAEGVRNLFSGAAPTWTYDAFGNRTTETWSGTGGHTVPASTTANYSTATNQLSGAQYSYDAAGNVIGDGLNSYLYDAEGRLCAVKNSTGLITGYVYDAAGTRVARGTLSTFSCNFAPSNFSTTTSWVLGPGEEQVTEYAVSGGASTWAHTNAFAGGALLATYAPSGSSTDTYFALTDWLGTKRVEVSAGGCYSYFTSMPYGDGLTPNGNCLDATEHHFTGKERDTESGNDYFGARYYASAMGRFLSPDWSAKVVPVPYAILNDPQSLNLYAYVRNNPLSEADADGHCEPLCGWIATAIANWVTNGIVRDGSPKAFAKNVGIGLAKGAGMVPAALAVGGLNQLAPGLGNAALMTKTGMKVGSALMPSNTTQAQVARVGTALATTALTAGVGAGVSALEGMGEAAATTTLFRAVMPAEAESIDSLGAFTNPLGTEVKYFSTSLEGAQSYASQASAAFGDGPFSFYSGEFPTSSITPDMTVTVDRGVDSVVIPTEQLQQFTPPTRIP